jgi:hypothetical protein
MFMFGVAMFRQKSILVLGGSARKTKISSRWGSGSRGLIGRKDDGMQSARMTVAWRERWEQVFPFLSRLVSRRRRPCSVDVLVWGSMTRWAIDSGISSMIGCGKDSGGWRDGRLQLKITPAAL